MPRFRIYPVAYLVATATASPALPRAGSAAWVYDVTGGQPAMWAGDIAAFNAVAKQPINTIFSYGGDMEYYPATPTPYNTYFPPENQQGASYVSVKRTVPSRMRLPRHAQLLPCTLKPLVLTA